MSVPKTCFAASDLDWFAAIGHDTNPLHLDAEYAHKSAFGDRVVHGVLAAMTTLQRLPARAGQRLRKIVFEFPRPIFCGVEYAINVEPIGETRSALRLVDGSMLLVRGMAEMAEGAALPLAPGLFEAHVEPRPARRTRDEDLVAGTRLDLPYGLTAHACRELEERYGLASRGIGPWEASILLGTSYIVGMHLPGERALFSRLELTFSDDVRPVKPLSFTCVVKGFDTRMNLLRVNLEARSGDDVVARGELAAFARRSAAASERTPVSIGASADLAGKVALVIGGSRGLGASLALAMAARGAAVLVSFAKSEAEARELESLGRTLPGSIELLQGDGGDPEWCERVRSELAARYGRIDFLFCNASPALRPLWLEPSARDRIYEYVSRSLELVGTPLMAFVGSMKEDGWIVTTSSIAVREPVAEWPHYVAAKQAIEGLVNVASREYPKLNFLVTRPPRLLTDFAPNLGAAQSALPPERVADVIVRRLTGPQAKGRVETLEEM